MTKIPERIISRKEGIGRLKKYIGNKMRRI
jgi:hypothetical protein